MSGVKAVPMLRHPGCGVPLPWWDVRVVPQQTLMDYLACDRGRWATLVQSGMFAGEGGTVTCGAIRPQTSYVPAVIWAHNGWVPSPAALAALVVGDKAMRDLLDTAERTVAELRQLALGGVQRPSRTAASIPFPTPVSLQR